MTTLRRSIPIVPTPYTQRGLQGYNPINGTMGTPLSATKTTFRPVNPGTLLELMGYVTAGLPDLGVPEGDVAIYIYKWHTWLRRMNAWMRENEAFYPKLLDLPQGDGSELSKKDYFLGSMSSLIEQASKADSAKLGPLLPGDRNTLINALARGVHKTPGAGKQTERSLTQFIVDVDRIATHLVTGSAVSGNSTKSTTDLLATTPLPAYTVLPTTSVVMPSNPTVNTGLTLPPGTATGIATASTTGNGIASATPVSALFTSPGVVGPSVSQASPIQISSLLNTVITKVKALPNWAHALLLLAILFSLLKKGPNTGTRRIPSIDMPSNTGPISQFTLPPVDPLL